MEVPFTPGLTGTVEGLKNGLSIEEKENRLTKPANPLLLVTMIGVTSVPPGGAISRVFTDEIVKSGPVTVTERYVVRNRLQPLAPLTVTV